MKHRIWGVTCHPSSRVEITRPGGDSSQPNGQIDDATPSAGGVAGMSPRRASSRADESGAQRAVVRAAGISEGHRRPVRRVVLLVVALLAVACGGAGAPAAQGQKDISSALDAAGVAVPEPQTGTVAKSAKPKRVRDDAQAADAGAASGNDTAAAEAAPDAVRKGTAKAPVATEAPLVTQPRDAVAATATVVPECVRPGGTVTITVTTRPTAGVGYHAFYADGKGGGPPPYGNSYGGNDGGLADDDGRYTDTFTVAPNAPVGPGRVDVIVGHNNEFGNTKATFAVSDAVTGACAP